MQEKKDVILNAQEMALVLTISEFTIKKLAKNNEIPCTYKNRKMLFNINTVARHFQEIEGVAS